MEMAKPVSPARELLNAKVERRFNSETVQWAGCYY